MLYQEQPNNQVSNLYNIDLINKTRDSLPVVLKLENMHGEIKLVGKDLMVKKEGVTKGEFFVYLNKNELKGRKTKLEIGIYSNNKKIRTVNTSFLGPVLQ